MIFTCIYENENYTFPGEILVIEANSRKKAEKTLDEICKKISDRHRIEDKEWYDKNKNRLKKTTKEEYDKRMEDFIKDHVENKFDLLKKSLKQYEGHVFVCSEQIRKED